jgi:hypothetical protein
MTAALAPGTAASLRVSDHELLCSIGRGAYGEVWLARNVLGELRAVKIIRRSRFVDPRPFEREFEGIQRFEPISRSHPSQLAILRVGKNDAAGCFYYVVELADQAEPGPNIVAAEVTRLISPQSEFRPAATTPQRAWHSLRMRTEREREEWLPGEPRCKTDTHRLARVSGRKKPLAIKRSTVSPFWRRRMTACTPIRAPATRGWPPRTSGVAIM